MPLLNDASRPIPVTFANENFRLRLKNTRIKMPIDSTSTPIYLSARFPGSQRAVHHALLQRRIDLAPQRYLTFSVQYNPKHISSNRTA